MIYALTGIRLLLDCVSLNDLFNKLFQARSILLSLEHLAVDGDLSIEGLKYSFLWLTVRISDFIFLYFTTEYF